VGDSPPILFGGKVLWGWRLGVDLWKSAGCTGFGAWVFGGESRGGERKAIQSLRLRLRSGLRQRGTKLQDFEGLVDIYMQLPSNLLV